MFLIQTGVYVLGPQRTRTNVIVQVCQYTREESDEVWSKQSVAWFMWLPLLGVRDSTRNIKTESM
jgi:hypothetical protein